MGSPEFMRAHKVVRDLNLGATAVSVSTSTGYLRGWYLFNTTATIIYVKFYNKVGATEADTPILTLPVPGTSGSTGAGANFMEHVGIRFDQAISMRATTGVADADTTAPAANGLIANIFYNNHAI